MLAVDRHKAILEKLNAEGSIIVSAISKELGVTEETIRRDLEKLEKNSRLVRVRGGAFLQNTYEREAPVKLREAVFLEEKKMIANECCKHIQEYDCIMLDSSTTAYYIAKRLKELQKKVTIITNSLDTIKEFEDSELVRVLCIGGTLRVSTRSFMSAESLAFFDGRFADKAFVSSGLHKRFGITERLEMEAQIRRRMLENSSVRYLVLDNTKFDRAALSSVCSLDSVDVVITDTLPSSDWQGILSEKKIELIVCDKSK